LAASSENLELMTATVRLILKNAPTITTNQKYRKTTTDAVADIQP